MYVTFYVKLNSNISILNSFLQHLLRRVLENQHKLIQQILVQSVRNCSGSARLQEAPKVEDDTEFMNMNTIAPTTSYYPLTPFKHDQDVGEQFKVKRKLDFQ